MPPRSWPRRSSILANTRCGRRSSTWLTPVSPCGLILKRAQGQNSLILWPRRWVFWSLARREERSDLPDHERRATTPATKRPAALRVAAKIAAGFVERLDRIADTLFAFLLPG